MVETLLLAAVLAAAPAGAAPDPEAAASSAPPATVPAGAAPDPVAATSSAPPPAALQTAPLWLQEDWDDQPAQEEEGRPHLLLSLWGGEAIGSGGSGRTSSFLAAEVAWAFSQLDLGLQGIRYRSLRDSTRPWTPVVLTRVTERFKTRSGVEAAFSVGFGAGQPSHWVGWYQVAIGARLPLGPVFLAGELAFEQYDLLRLGGGLGFAF